MPWKETRVMDSRMEFVMRALREELDFGELCQEYGISRKTGYKWKKRFEEDGHDVLVWKDADPGLQPQVQEARDRLQEIVRARG